MNFYFYKICFILIFYSQTKKTKQMKFNLEMFISVAAALIVVGLLNKFVLDGLSDKVAESLELDK